MRDPLPIVQTLGYRLGWKEQKALVLFVAMNGPWEPAAQLADALGVPEHEQERIYREALAHIRAGHPTVQSDRAGERPARLAATG